MTQTVAFKAVFGRQRDSRPARRTIVEPAQPQPCTEGGGVRPVSRLARQLALAYRVRELLRSGALPDQREAAVRLGIVFPQMTHVMNLLHLAPDVQEAILSGRLIVSEAALRPVARIHSWKDQRTASRQAPHPRRRG
jgi:hypothetical protein